MQTINKKGLTVKKRPAGGFFMVELRGILRWLRRLRAALHCFAAQSPLRFAQLPRKRGRMCTVEPRRTSRDPQFYHEKNRPDGRFFSWWNEARGGQTPCCNPASISRSVIVRSSPE